MRKLPPLNAVRIFEAAARNLSFTVAANELNITTAAVSHQIRNLEELLGAKLFERTSRNVRLSAVGERLFPLLTEGFDKLADAFSELDERKSASVVSLTTTRSFAERWLLPRLPRFQSAHPDVMVNVDASDTVIDLRSGEADIAIRYGRNEDDGLTPIGLFTDKYLAVCHSSIWDKEAIPKLTDLKQRYLLACRWINQSNAPDWARWLRLAGIDRSAFQINWFSEEGLSIQAMERGYGPLLCSNALVSDQLRDGTCRRIEGPELDGLRYRLLIAPSSTRKKGVQSFTSWVREEVANFVCP
jgi:LysR family glycine cleavage system transcriptional activator